MDRDSLTSEARAKIFWGEAPADVRDFLVSNGLAEPEANSAVRQFCVERNKEVRRCGVRRIVVGAALMLPGAFALYLVAGKSHWHGSLVAAGKGVGVALMIGLYGFYKFVNGIIDVSRPQLEHDSISEME